MPNYLSHWYMWGFIAIFFMIIGADFYYLAFYSRNFAVFPADYDPRTNFQLLLYYEAFLTPSVLLCAMTIFVCYIAYPIIIIVNLPQDWNIIIKFIFGFFSILTSFAYVAAIMGFTIIGYELFANYWPSKIGIRKYKEN